MDVSAAALLSRSDAAQGQAALPPTLRLAPDMRQADVPDQPTLYLTTHTQGAGVRVGQCRIKRRALICSPPPVLCPERAFPHPALSHTGEGDPSRFPRFLEPPSRRLLRRLLRMRVEL